MASEAEVSWDVVAYEVRMFRATTEIMLNTQTLASLTKVYANAVEESAVLHVRILCDVFLCKTISPDDIQLAQLFPDYFTSRRYDRLRGLTGNLRNKYGTAQRTGSYCWVFNKMMAHPTAHRGKSYDYTSILRELAPIIRKIVSEIERLRDCPFTWMW